MAARLLAVQRAITSVLHRYFRAVDQLNEELLTSAYHPDAIHDHSAFCGSCTHAFVIRAMEKMVTDYEAIRHRLSNVTRLNAT